MPEEASTQEEKKEVVVEQTTETQTALEDFEWDDGSGDFFGIEGTAVVEKDEVAEVIAEVTKETTPPAATTETPETPEEDDDFFGIVEKPDGTITTKEEVEEEGVNYYSDTFAKMKKEGVFQNVEDLEEGEELTQEKFIELQDNEVESRVDEAFEGFFAELDDDAAAFLKHKKEGGSTQDFFSAYGKTTGVPTGDLDDEAYQEKLVRHYYNSEGGDSDETDDKIEWLKSSGKLEKYAQKFDTKIKEDEVQAKLDLKESTKAATKAADEGRVAFVTSVQEALAEADQIQDFKFTPKTKKALLPFITKATVKVGKNRYVTGMQSKLQTALKTPEKMLILAQLLENDFDVSSIVANATTVNTRKLKDDIQRQKRGSKPTGSGRTGKKRSLADIDF